MHTSNLSRKLFCAFLILLITFINIQNPSKAQEKSLYERLGGVTQIAAVVDDFVDKLLTDPIITANKNTVAGLAHTTKPGLKYLITEMVCQASGGPQKYTGKSMKEAHKDLKISEAEWEAMVKDFLNTLAKLKVPNKEQIELIVIVGSVKGDIVSALPAPQAQALPSKPTAAPQPAPAPQAQTAPSKPVVLPNAPAQPAPQAPSAPVQPAPEAIAPAPQPHADTIPVIPVVPAQPEAAPAEELPVPSDLPPDAQIVPAQ